MDSDRLRSHLGLGIIVPGYGPIPSSIMAVGEAPGRDEAFARPFPRPFVGHSGAELRWYLRNRHLRLDSWYLTNLVKLYIKGNPDPTPELIAKWGPDLESEVRKVRPRVIIAIGRYSARYFIGNSLTMEMAHGIPHTAGALDPSILHRAQGAIIFPMFHPALGLHRSEARPAIDWDAEQLAILLDHLGLYRFSGKRYYYEMPKRPPLRIESPADLSRYDYQDVTAKGFVEYLGDTMGRYDRDSDLYHNRTVWGCDTEGSRHRPWSIQASSSPGSGVILRSSRPKFRSAISAFGDFLLSSRVTLLLHNAPHDIAVIKSAGLDLTHPKIRVVDTMALPYLLATESQKLKVLAYRWLARKRDDFSSLTDGAALPLQIAYLQQVAAAKLPAPGKLIRFKDWRYQTFSPWSISRRAVNLLAAVGKGLPSPDDDDIPTIDSDEDDEDIEVASPDSVDVDAAPISLLSKWNAIPREVTQPAVDRFGPFPRPSIDLIPLRHAIGYAVADADDTLGIYSAMFPGLQARNLSSTLDESMSVLSMFSAMQDGLPVSRSYLRRMSRWLERTMLRKHDKLCDRYNNGKHLNPGSPPQVREFLARHGIHPTKKTKTGQISTSKKSIEPFRFAAKDAPPSIQRRARMVNLLLECREVKHLKDSFADPLLRRADSIALSDEEGIPIAFGVDSGIDVVWVPGSIKHTRTATRRPAMADPNWLNIPTRTDMGRKLRGAVRAPEGFVIISCDLSQVEARIFASKAADPLLIKMFLSGGDIHKETAATVFDVPLDDVTSEQRRAAKTINFGILYGMTPNALYTQLAMLGLPYTQKDCKEIYSIYMGKYVRVPAYISEVKQETLRTLESRDDAGMPRPLPGIRHYDTNVVEESIRFAVSQRIQGSAQAAIQRAMRRLRKPLYSLRQVGVRLLLEIHDELIFLAPIEYAESVADLAVDALENHHGLTLAVPLKSGRKIAQSWDELKD